MDFENLPNFLEMFIRGLKILPIKLVDFLESIGGYGRPYIWGHRWL